MLNAPFTRRSIAAKSTPLQVLQQGIVNRRYGTSVRVNDVSEEFRSPAISSSHCGNTCSRVRSGEPSGIATPQMKQLSAPNVCGRPRRNCGASSTGPNGGPPSVFELRSTESESWSIVQSSCTKGVHGPGGRSPCAHALGRPHGGTAASRLIAAAATPSVVAAWLGLATQTSGHWSCGPAAHTGASKVDALGVPPPM